MPHLYESVRASWCVSRRLILSVGSAPFQLKRNAHRFVPLLLLLPITAFVTAKHAIFYLFIVRFLFYFVFICMPSTFHAPTRINFLYVLDPIFYLFVIWARLACTIFFFLHSLYLSRSNAYKFFVCMLSSSKTRSLTGKYPSPNGGLEIAIPEWRPLRLLYASFRDNLFDCQR